MKIKIYLLLLLAVGLGLKVNAQIDNQQRGYSDRFFTSDYKELREGDGVSIDDYMGTMPMLMGHGENSSQTGDAPVGSGLLLLAGMGLLYAKRKREP